MTTVVVGALTGCVPEAEAETPKPQSPPELVSGGPSTGGFYMYCTPINRTPGFYCTPVDGNAPPITTPPLAPPTTVDPPAPAPTPVAPPPTSTTRPPLFEGSPDPTAPPEEPIAPPISDEPTEPPSDPGEGVSGTGGAAGAIS